MSSRLKKVLVLFGVLSVICLFNENLSAQKVRLRSNVSPPCVNMGPPNQQNLKFADLYADGNIAVMGTRNCVGVFIFDITNPDAPVMTAHYNPDNIQVFVEAVVVGNRGYFGSIWNDGVHIVDLTNPYNPVLLGKVDPAHGNGFTNIHEIVVWGNYLIENTNPAADHKKIRFINISNPANPVFVREMIVNDANFVHAMHIRGNRMFTSGWGTSSIPGQTEIYDISNIETQAPVLLGTIVETVGTDEFDGNTDVHSSWTSEDGYYLYSCREAFDENGDIRVFDIHDPAQPVLVKRIRTKTDLGLVASTPHNPVVVGNLLYVAWYEAGLQVFDITNPANPVRIAQYDTFPESVALTAEQREARLKADPNEAICGRSASNNAILTAGGVLGVYPFLGPDKILVSDEWRGLFILDASRVNAPLENQVSDFDGDGKTDFSVYTPASGVWSVEKSANGALSSTQFGLATDKIQAGDFDGDGKSDLAVWRPNEGVWYILGSTRGFFAAQFGANGDIPLAGDYDADGKTDFAVFRPSNGTWYIQQSIMGFRGTQFGISTDKPMVGDFEGDGKLDLAVFRPSNGTWYILQSSTTLLRGARFGISTDKPVTGDFDGDSKTDLAVYRPGEGNWYIMNSRNNSLSIYRFGIASDTPIPADYDGDGKTDVAVFRASENAWYRLNSTNGAFVARNFGQNGDIPSPSSIQP
jgi:hypothetical protein